MNKDFQFSVTEFQHCNTVFSEASMQRDLCEHFYYKSIYMYKSPLKCVHPTCMCFLFDCFHAGN